MFTFLLVLQSLVALSLVTVILLQRSEGGGLGVGGSSAGFMTARGAADFLTRSTAVLGAVFILLSITMAAVAGVTNDAPTLDTSLATGAPVQGTPAAPATPAPAAPAPAGPTVPLAQ